jgi:nucleotide-binding universal stress UspA family protein
MAPAQIVVGVDGSTEAEGAVRWAAERARGTGAPLRLLHAYALPVPTPGMPLAAVAPYPVNPDEYARAGEAVLAAAAEVARGAAAEVPVHTDLRAGGAAPALIEASTDAGLVVVGSRGLGGFTGLLLGSVGVQVSIHAHCPTAVIRGDTAAAGPVVVGVDGSPASHTALDFAFAEAQRLGRSVRAVHAWGAPLPTGPGEAAALVRTHHVGREAPVRAANQLLAEALAPHRRSFPDVEVDELLTEAGAAPALLEAARDAVLVVIGSRGRGGFAGLLLGSTSQTLVHHAPCPVVVTRPGQSGPAV